MTFTDLSTLSKLAGIAGSLLVLAGHAAISLRWSWPAWLVQTLSGLGAGLLAAHLIYLETWGPAALNAIWLGMSAWALVLLARKPPVVWSNGNTRHPKLEQAMKLLRGAGLSAGMSESQVVALAQEILSPLGEKLLIVRADRSALVFANVMRNGAVPVHEHLCTDQFELVIRGNVAVTVGAEQATLGPGEFVWIPRKTPHTLAPVDADGAIVSSVVLGTFHPLAFFRTWDGTPLPGALDTRQRDQLSRDLWTLARTRIVDLAGTAVQKKGDRP
jgi:mannose-6-phosphate isomerase-like protein (cupin superfamily)